MKNTAIGWITAIFLLLQTMPAHSCSCGGPYNTVFCQSVSAGRHIIRGELVERTHPSFARVAVLENIDRDVSYDTITIMGQDGVNCGESLYLLSEGAEYVLALIPLTGAGPDTLMLLGCSKNFYPIENEMVLGQIIPGLSNMPYETLRDNIAGILSCTFAGPSFISEANRWNLLFGGFDFTNGNIYMYTMIYEFRDTIVRNGRIYKRLWSTQDSLLMGFEPTQEAFREEAGGKVYRYSEYVGEEMLIYDFALVPGDEIQFEGYLNYYVEAVDSVQLADGSRRKRLKIALEALPSSDAVFWIEGLGSEVNTFMPENAFIIDAYAHLLCFYQEEELLHITQLVGSAAGCYQFLVDAEAEDTAFGWEVFPNPATDMLSIVFRRPAAGPLHLRLLNPLGQVVKAQRLPAFAERASWDVAGLAPGVYFVELLEEGKRVGGRKVVKRY
ncbi:MAG: T9SS type A sorting domain-containing protein [Phaeodactylibacter sp.]|nr:T9SS type A sorting domain-containing protein [Phaeodactylibacter sp.]